MVKFTNSEKILISLLTKKKRHRQLTKTKRKPKKRRKRVYKRKAIPSAIPSSIPSFSTMPAKEEPITLAVQPNYPMQVFSDDKIRTMVDAEVKKATTNDDNLRKKIKDIVLSEPLVKKEYVDDLVKLRLLEYQKLNYPQIKDKPKPEEDNDEEEEEEEEEEEKDKVKIEDVTVSQQKIEELIKDEPYKITNYSYKGIPIWYTPTVVKQGNFTRILFRINLWLSPKGLNIDENFKPQLPKQTKPFKITDERWHLRSLTSDNVDKTLFSLPIPNTLDSIPNDINEVVDITLNNICTADAGKHKPKLLNKIS